ncbi:MAG: HEPN domain-containing protein [Gammaproteobacteria bacterium]|nr:HEPN domain-containing protein [Gammaproteobacteria bacterium]
MTKSSKGQLKYEISELNMMLSIALAFRYSTESLEKEILSMDIAPEDHTPISGPNTRTKHEVWVAYKAVSHFTLHQAFESFVKYVLAVEGVAVPKIHTLAKLYDRLSNESKHKFQNIHDDTLLVPQKAIAFMYSNVKPPTPKPAHISTVRQQFEFMDQRMRLHLRRYQADDIRKKQFTTYYTDLGPYFAMLDGISKYAHTLKFS